MLETERLRSRRGPDTGRMIRALLIHQPGTHSPRLGPASTPTLSTVSQKDPLNFRVGVYTPVKPSDPPQIKCLAQYYGGVDGIRTRDPRRDRPVF